MSIQRIARHARFQHGYSLVELSIVLVIIALVIMSVIAMQVEQARDDKARQVAQAYTRLNNAVGTYITNNYDRLIKLNAGCALNPYSTDMHSKWNIDAYNNDMQPCRLTINNRTIHNGLQPTLQELRDYGVLGDFSSNELPLPANTQDYRVSFPSGLDERNGQSRWMVIIRKLCIGASGMFSKPGEPYYVENNNGHPGCEGTTDLDSLIFNVHPYAVANLGGGVFLSRVQQHMGVDGYLSDLDPDPRRTGFGEELRAIRGSINATISNPMRVNVTWEGGPGSGDPWPYILAMRNGYGSSGWDKYVRRDGSTPMTSNWDYGGKNVSSINGLQVGPQTPATVNGQMGVTKAPGNADLSGPVTIDGGNTTYVDKNTGKLVVSERKQGKLTVYGETTLNGGTTINNSLTVGQPGECQTLMGGLGRPSVTNCAPGAGNVMVNGALTSETGVFGALNDAAKAATATLKTVSLYIQDTLKVAGLLTADSLNITNASTFGGKATFNGGLETPANATAKFNGDAYFFGKAELAKLKIGNSAKLGAACNPTDITFALEDTSTDNYGKGLRLLVCRGSVWERPQETFDASNLQNQIDQATGALAKMTVKTVSLTFSPDAGSDTNAGLQDTGLSCTAFLPPILVAAVNGPTNSFGYNCVNGNWYYFVKGLKTTYVTLLAVGNPGQGANGGVVSGSISRPSACAALPAGSTTTVRYRYTCTIPAGATTCPLEWEVPGNGGRNHTWSPFDSNWWDLTYSYSGTCGSATHLLSGGILTIVADDKTAGTCDMIQRYTLRKDMPMNAPVSEYRSVFPGMSFYEDPVGSKWFGVTVSKSWINPPVVNDKFVCGDILKAGSTVTVSYPFTCSATDKTGCGGKTFWAGFDQTAWSYNFYSAGNCRGARAFVDKNFLYGQFAPYPDGAYGSCKLYYTFTSLRDMRFDEIPDGWPGQVFTTTGSFWWGVIESKSW